MHATFANCGQHAYYSERVPIADFESDGNPVIVVLLTRDTHKQSRSWQCHWCGRNTGLVFSQLRDRLFHSNEEHGEALLLRENSVSNAHASSSVHLETLLLADYELWRTLPTDRHACDKELVPDFAPIITPRVRIMV
ncbi:hypothetical protein KCU81_g8714, partial [Aureobasidium melanogenum]|uniref:Uncharacterized protein n=1 Tax=Aureobasidium melanogenum (strain CBS 110374) TaxID=1043003 RepID=A0A074VVS1_AURM1